MRLATLQRLFSEALRDPRREIPATLIGEIAPRGLPAERRLGVYQANALGALTRTLDKTYPVCRQILGERYFAQLSRGFALQTRASSADLDDYGHGFPDHLLTAVDRREELRDFAYLPDLARLERAVRQAWLAADSPGFDLAGFQASLAETPAEGHRLHPAESLTLLGSDWPVDRIWSLHQSGEAPAELAAEGHLHFCVCRHQDAVSTERLDPSAYQLLTRLVDGCSLGELSGFAVDRDIALDTLLPGMIEKGWICGYSAQPIRTGAATGSGTSTTHGRAEDLRTPS